MSSLELLRLSFPSIRNPEKRLRAGCYVIRYFPDVLEEGVSHYEGTLRVQHLDKDKSPVPSDGEFLLASGDLYARHDDSKQPPAGIPIFPREDYRYYLCLKDVPEWSISATGFSFIFESHAFYHNGDQWNFRGNFQADMIWTLPPPGYPFDYLEGQVFEKTGRPNGRVTMAWVSEYFRRAIVQIDREPGVMAPLGDDKVDGEVNWSHVFKDADWQMEVVALENPMAKPQKQSWTEGELADQLPNLCRSHDLDSVWRYYLLSVNKVDRVERGITYYYAPADDPARNFREVAVAVAGYEFRGDKWGKVRGTRLQDSKKLYFRVAVHEIGHAMSLEHNTADKGFMNTTEQLAIDILKASVSEDTPDSSEDTPDSSEDTPDSSEDTPEFSEDTPKYSFWLGDRQRLRHWPDIVVRPGTLVDSQSLPSNGVPVFPENGADDIPAANTAKEQFKGIDYNIFTLPNWKQVPLGAPVRIRLELANVSVKTVQVPTRLSLKSGYVTATVIGPDKSVRGLSALINHMDAAAVEPLQPGDKKSGSITLLQDDGGNPLFPVSGKYQIKIHLLWRPGRTEVQAQAETTVLVTPLKDSDHSAAARAVLNTQDFLFVLALADDSSAKAVDALRLTLRSEILRPHFVFARFRLMTQPSGEDRGDLNAACEFLKAQLPSAVLSAEDIADIVDTIEDSFSKSTDAHLIEKVLKLLEAGASAVRADAETTDGIAAIQDGLSDATNTISTAFQEARIATVKAAMDSRDKLTSTGSQLTPMTNEQILASLKGSWGDLSVKAPEDALRKRVDTLEKRLSLTKYQKPSERIRNKIEMVRIQAFLDAKDWENFFLPKTSFGSKP